MNYFIYCKIVKYEKNLLLERLAVKTVRLDLFALQRIIILFTPKRSSNASS